MTLLDTPAAVPTTATRFSSLLAPSGATAAPEVVGATSLEDLALDGVLAALRRRDEEDVIDAVFRRPVDDPAVIRYRQGVFAALEHPEVRRSVDAFVDVLASIRWEARRPGHAARRAHVRLSAVQRYCGAVPRLAAALTAALDRAGAASDALRGLAEHAGRVATTQRFDALRDAVRLHDTACVRAHRLMPDCATGPLDAGLHDGTQEALHAWADGEDGFVDDALERSALELGFFTGYLDLVRPLRRVGLRFTYPAVAGTGADVAAQEVFDLGLARVLVADGDPVGTNDLATVGPRHVLAVFGPDPGLPVRRRLVRQLQHLAALGCPVPGAEVEVSLPAPAAARRGAEGTAPPEVRSAPRPVVRVETDRAA